MSDNVRKVFDMLGVEPNEKFKVKGFEFTKYYMDDNLIMFDEDSNAYDNLFRVILLNNDMIIKLSKEPKKKLRDLTVEEYKNYYIKNYSDCLHSNCTCCLFNNVYCNIFDQKCWIHHKELYSDEFLDQEVEVEE